MNNPAPFTQTDYVNILQTALDSNYSFIRFSELTKLDTPRNQILLRHDVDQEIHHILELATLENKLNIKATYFVMLRSSAYNLLSLESRKVIFDLLDMGHELGLHFMGELHRSNPTVDVISEISREISILESEFKTQVTSFSLHQPTQAEIQAKYTLPGIINTYHPDELSAFKYISDSNMNWREGHPAAMIAAKTHLNLQILTHPMWWTKDTLSLDEKWQRIWSQNHDVYREHIQKRELSLSS